jgi:hypothetical protein
MKMWAEVLSTLSPEVIEELRQATDVSARVAADVARRRESDAIIDAALTRMGVKK